MAIHSLPSSDAPCIAPVLEGIPPELRERAQWVVHKCGAPYAARHTERRNGRAWGKGNKVDYTDPAKLSTCEEAWQLYLAGGWEGVGYTILASNPFTLIDIDHCLRGDGSVAPTVAYWVARLALLRGDHIGKMVVRVGPDPA
jgi:primase-polymerase (primpol)-like protein